MTEITISGNLRRGEGEYDSGKVYWLDVARKSGTVDTLMVLSPKEDLITGDVHIKGQIKAEFIKGMGVPTFIVPESVEAGEADGVSEAVIEGTLKNVPKCRSTSKAKIITTIIIKTDEGHIPVILWGSVAKRAERSFQAGIRLKVMGRIQSREYPDRKGNKRTAYEVSATKVEVL